MSHTGFPSLAPVDIFKERITLTHFLVNMKSPLLPDIKGKGFLAVSEGKTEYRILNKKCRIMKLIQFFETIQKKIDTKTLRCYLELKSIEYDCVSL